MEYLFRAKEKDTCKDGQWTYGSGIIPVTIDNRRTGKFEMINNIDYDQIYGYNANMKRICIYPNTIGQFTGEIFRDTKGDLHKIFVGDVLKVCMEGIWQEPLYVIEDLKSFYLDFAQENIDEYYRITDAILVGNIHDNPELLERK